eukprot:Opistho-2@86260
MRLHNACEHPGHTEAVASHFDWVGGAVLCADCRLEWRRIFCPQNKRMANFNTLFLAEMGVAHGARVALFRLSGIHHLNGVVDKGDPGVTNKLLGKNVRHIGSHRNLSLHKKRCLHFGCLDARHLRTLIRVLPHDFDCPLTSDNRPRILELKTRCLSLQLNLSGRALFSVHQWHIKRVAAILASHEHSRCSNVQAGKRVSARFGVWIQMVALLANLPVGGVSAACACEQCVLASGRENVEFVALETANVTSVCKGLNEFEIESFEDALIRPCHVSVRRKCVVIGDIERVHVFHPKLAPAHETRAGPCFVAEFAVHLIETEGQLAIRIDEIGDELRYRLLVCGCKAKRRVLAIFQAEKLLSR